jgi:hypothetical protein
MKVKFIEAVEKTTTNWGKFMIGRFDSEWEYRNALDGRNFLASRGWGPDHLLVLDMQTGEGAIFKPGGLASHDLNEKHQIWVTIYLTQPRNPVRLDLWKVVLSMFTCRKRSLKRSSTTLT